MLSVACMPWVWATTSFVSLRFLHLSFVSFRLVISVVVFFICVLMCAERSRSGFALWFCVSILHSLSSMWSNFVQRTQHNHVREFLWCTLMYVRKRENSVTQPKYKSSTDIFCKMFVESEGFWRKITKTPIQQTFGRNYQCLIQVGVWSHLHLRTPQNTEQKVVHHKVSLLPMATLFLNFIMKNHIWLDDFLTLMVFPNSVFYCWIL